MRVDQMRKIISEAYPGHKWRKKVNAMHNKQVIAVYHKIIEQRRKLLKKMEEEKCQEKENRQMMFW